MAPVRVVYLVSGDVDIEGSATNLQRSGRRVRKGSQVASVASEAIQFGGRFVIVAHGDSDGTVYWTSAAGGEAIRWLWVGMDDPPRSARLYLYACKAGKKLPRSLKNCQAIGHDDVVPMPDDQAKSIVLQFLTKVDELMRRDEFETTEWRKQLGEFVNQAFVAEVEAPTGILDGALWLMLRRSLGYVD